MEQSSAKMKFIYPAKMQKQTDNEKTETFRYKKKNIFFYKLTL